MTEAAASAFLRAAELPLWLRLRSRVALLGAALGLCGTAATASAQQLETGLHYYAVQDVASGEFTQRGTAGSNGIAFTALILTPGQHRLWILQATSLEIGSVDTEVDGRAPFRNVVPDIFIRQDLSPDADGDGLHDAGERIMGTDRLEGDTDGDGVGDAAEVQNGTNPTDGLAVRTGILAAATVPGTAADVAAFDDLAVVVSETGLSLFNVFNGTDPILVAQVPLPGAHRVAFAGAFAAVARGSAGLSVVDLRDPPAAAVTRTVTFGSGVAAVATAAGFAFVGLADARVLQIDMATGAVTSQLQLTSPVEDLALADDELLVLTRTALASVTVFSGPLALEGTTLSPVPTGFNRRLAAGRGIAHAVHARGYNTFDVSGHGAPVVLSTAVSTQFGWQHLALNGSGSGLASLGVAFDLGPATDVWRFDVSDPSQPYDLRATFPTPGEARSVAIHAGLAHVADGTRGLQVVNYLSADTLRIPPTLALDTNFSPGLAEEGQVFRATALVDDDVQVRNVEFWLDGRRVASDGTFPFEHRFVTPLLAEQRTFTLRARAFDTGGNATWTSLESVQLVADARRPRVLVQSPGSGAIVASVPVVSATLSEPIDEATIQAPAFTLAHAGPDGITSTPDDVAVAGTVSWSSESHVLRFTPTSALAPGAHRAVVGPPVADLAGNGLLATAWSFFVAGGTDTDGDGIPDAAESLLGLNPNDADSDNDGVPDGAEDGDGDGVTNAVELAAGLNPADADSDDDGIPDGAEDQDADGLSDAGEAVRGTSLTDKDSDDDGFADGIETALGSDPTSAGSTPVGLVGAAPGPRLIRIGVAVAGEVPLGVTVAQPPARLLHVALQAGPGGPAPNTTVARPPIHVELAP